MKEYEYTKLPSEDHIRIMELLPGIGEDPIHIHLTAELRQDTTDTYDAISYTWGNGVKSDEVICSNEILLITPSLAGALREFRSEKLGNSYRLWVDGVCIDQSNKDRTEKNHQVKRMGGVYKNARRVLAWLGPDDEGIAEDCFEIVKGWNQYLDEQLRIWKHPRDIPPLKPPHHLCSDLEQGRKLQKLMNCPWFSRAWVLQEAGLAKVCSLHWGNHSMNFAELMEFVCFWDGCTDLPRLIGGVELIFRLWGLVFRCVYRIYNNPVTWRCDMDLIRFWNNKHGHGRGLFLDTLLVGKFFSVEYAPDHINAFLGSPLAFSSDGKLLLEPDYSKSEKEVYYDAALAFLTSSREAPFVLCFVQHEFAQEVTGSSGPSWIPRWSRSLPGRTPSHTIGNIGLWFKAGGLVDRLQYQVESGVGAERLLCLQGVFFDHLIWTSEPLKHGNFALEPSQWDSGLHRSRQPYIDLVWNEIVLAFQQWSDPTKVSDNALYDEFIYTLVTGYKKDTFVRLKDHRKKLGKYFQALKDVVHSEDRSEAAPLSSNNERTARNFESDMHNCENRRLALTERGRIALVPRFARPGDACCVFLGMVTPFIIRKASTQHDHNANYHHLVGEAYLHQVMGGELVDGLDRGEFEREEITLI